MKNKQLTEEGRDAWEIELTGGPGQDCPTCPNYNYSDLVDYYWPALISGVEYYSGQNTLQYVGHSNACRVALSSLEKYQASGKNNAGYVFNQQTGLYELKDLAVNPVETFVGVACPGTFVGDSKFIELVQANGQNLINYLSSNGKTHLTMKEVGQQLKAPLTIFFNSPAMISKNLMQFYLDRVNDVQDAQPGNVTINKILLVGGTFSLLELLSHDNDDDGIVTIDDISGINQKIISPNKNMILFNISHENLPDNPTIKFKIKEVL